MLRAGYVSGGESLCARLGIGELCPAIENYESGIVNVLF
jgi:hypothetical protein